MATAITNKITGRFILPEAEKKNSATQWGATDKGVVPDSFYMKEGELSFLIS